MAYLVKADLYNVIYQEIIDEITRGNDALVTTAIANAVSEAKTYLSRWDLLALFGAGATAPTITDEWLKCLVKDIAAWQLIKLSNPNIDYAHIRTCYEDAIKTLEKLQAGKMQPDGWTYKDTTGETAPEGNRVHASYNTKRTTRF
jgi:phage gp36-like protein